MNRLRFPGSSLTGAWRDGYDEARRLAFDGMAARLRLSHDMRTFLKLHAADLLALVRDSGDKEGCAAVGAVVVTMTRSMGWSEHLGRHISRADKMLTTLAQRRSTRPEVGEAIEGHLQRLRALRRRAADIIHLDVLACMAATRARTAGRIGRTRN